MFSAEKNTGTLTSTCMKVLELRDGIQLLQYFFFIFLFIVAFLKVCKSLCSYCWEYKIPALSSFAEKDSIV